MSLPTTPIAVISIPIISIASDITTANSGAPKPSLFYPPNPKENQFATIIMIGGEM
jgi:hypothetical protein